MIGAISIASRLLFVHNREGIDIFPLVKETLTVFERLSRSWELVKASYGVVRSHRELLLYPLVSVLATLVVMLVFAIPLFASGVVSAAAGDGELTSGQSILSLVLAFLFYFAMYTVVIFCNTALVGASLRHMQGKPATLRDGFQIASERINTILGYAAISATVGVILNAIRDEDNFLSQILASIVSVAWNLITFLVIPVLVVENVGPIEAIKRSGSLLKRTWGEQVVGAFSISLVFGIITFVAVLVIGLPLMLLMMATGSAVLIIFGIILVVLMVMAINLFGTTLNGVFQAALYRYATNDITSEEADEYFDESLLRNAFNPR